MAGSIAAAAARAVFLTHGEPDASDAPRKRIRSQLGWDAHVPEYRDTVDLLR